MIEPKRLAFCIKAYWPDIALSILLYTSVSIAVGRVWRFPFDDEIYTLLLFERNTVLEVLRYELGGNEVHPPLFYLLYSCLKALGLSVPALRLLSLAFTASALAMVHLVSLATMRDDDIGPLVRAAALLLFGLNALAISQGDALRWYPMFACLVSAFLLLYLGGRMRWSAIALGLGLATNYLGGLIIGSVAIHRYVLLRRFDLRADATFWSLTAGAGSLALISGASLMIHPAIAGGQLVQNSLEAPVQDALGFFGGHALGIGQAWLALPALAVALWAVIRLCRRGAGAEMLLVLLLGSVLVMPAIGLAKPRSFLYLAPVTAAVICVALSRSLLRTQLVALAASLLTATAAIGNIKETAHPFKRNAAVPYAAAIDFVHANSGRSLLVTTDPVLAWEIARDPRARAICVSEPTARQRTNCGRDGGYDSVLVAHGYNIMSRSPKRMAEFDAAVVEATAGMRRVAVAHFGEDKDAVLKRRLTGAPLDEAILTVDVYSALPGLPLNIP